ncbi:MAG: hypothetical protein QOG70_1681 [Solirubrobacteraceae bacterium]|nr:hypothetical protein [Solirubrobacteraceae bacterium]
MARSERRAATDWGESDDLDIPAKVSEANPAFEVVAHVREYGDGVAAVDLSFDGLREIPERGRKGGPYLG